MRSIFSFFSLVAYVIIFYVFPLFIIKKNYDNSKEINEEAMTMFVLGSICKTSPNVNMCFFDTNNLSKMESSEPQIREFLFITNESDEEIRKESFQNFALKAMGNGNERLAFFIWGLIQDPTFSKLSGFEIAKLRTFRDLSLDDLLFLAISETTWEKATSILLTIKF